jgi:tRNA A37 threonylcarbamoyladenosine synthetase subunit TsaC/SUA5/YrdC
MDFNNAGEAVTRPDIKGDARRAFDVLHAGGTAILPMDVGYSAIGGSLAALVKIFEAKARAPAKLNAMLGDMTLHREIHVLDQRGQEVVQALCEDYDLPLGAIAPARLDHPILRDMEPGALARSSHQGTVLMLLNAGPFHAEICRLSREAAHPLFGSSANRSLSGTKFRVDEIEPEICAVADIVIDHGLRKYHHYQASSTLLDLTTLEVLRHGACFELIADVLARHFGISLPPLVSDHSADLGPVPK